MKNIKNISDKPIVIHRGSAQYGRRSRETYPQTCRQGTAIHVDVATIQLDSGLSDTLPDPC